MRDGPTNEILANTAAVGFGPPRRTLCIGLDLAWYGGSANDQSSQFDFVAAATLDDQGTFRRAHLKRVSLVNRDPCGSLTDEAIADLINECGGDNSRVVLAIDAPLKTNRANDRKQYRSCERYFSTHRKRIDKLAGGSGGWHPNLQPGAMLAERVQNVLHSVEQTLEFEPWSHIDHLSERVVFECFPAEAIWAAKRMGRYPESFSATRAKAYKAQAGCKLSAPQVRSLVEDAVLDAFKYSTQTPAEWVSLVSEILTWMLSDKTWMRAGLYRGGKLLDDVVDSTLCLATAICYALGRAHVWQDPENPEDGHIIGPGLMQELLTWSTRLI